MKGCGTAWARWAGLLAGVSLVLAGCASSGGGGGATGDTVSGSAVKGPMANADLTVYAFDPTAPGFKGAVVTTATTNAAAAITGLVMVPPFDPIYIVEYTANAGTTDLTTGAAPVLPTLRTVLTAEDIATATPIYATPQSTMAVDLGVRNADANVPPYTGDNDGTVTALEFRNALAVASAQVVSTVGFGMTGTDLFTLPPLLTDATSSAADQAAVAAYRTAVEALTAILAAMGAGGAGPSFTELLDALTLDLSDGVVDGMAGAVAVPLMDAAALAAFAQDPTGLTIPGTATTVGDVEQLLVSETAVTGTGVDTSGLGPGTFNPVSAETDSDRDDDGHLNAEDAFPDDPSEWADTDGDGTGDNSDVCPADPADDADGDGACADVDNCPADANPGQADADLDGAGDACDVCPADADDDADGDGMCGDVDVCPLDPDNDVDGDGVCGDVDACPSDPNNDVDGDGVCGDVDNCPLVANPGQEDADSNGVGDACEPSGALPVVGFADLSLQVAEGAGSLDIDVFLTEASGADVSVAIGLDTNPGTATRGVDYQFTSPLVIPAGATGATLTVTIFDDAIAEGSCCPPSETVGLLITGATGADVSTFVPRMFFNILDDDSAVDSDGDGTPDASDVCPLDTDNDSDGDGVCVGATFNSPATAGDDNCPTDANPAQTDTDGDGKGDACHNRLTQIELDPADLTAAALGERMKLAFSVPAMLFTGASQLVDEAAAASVCPTLDEVPVGPTHFDWTVDYGPDSAPCTEATDRINWGAFTLRWTDFHTDPDPAPGGKIFTLDRSASDVFGLYEVDVSGDPRVAEEFRVDLRSDYAPVSSIDIWRVRGLVAHSESERAGASPDVTVEGTVVQVDWGAEINASSVSISEYVPSAVEVGSAVITDPSDQYLDNSGLLCDADWTCPLDGGADAGRLTFSYDQVTFGGPFCGGVAPESGSITVNPGRATEVTYYFGESVAPCGQARVGFVDIGPVVDLGFRFDGPDEVPPWPLVPAP
jgi:hypothetical protein